MKYEEFLSTIGKTGNELSQIARNDRTAFIVSFLQEIADKENLDMTPTLAYRFSVKLDGKGIALATLNQIFGQKGRTASNKSLDFSKFHDIADKYKSSFQEQRELQKEETKAKLARLDTKPNATSIRKNTKLNSLEEFNKRFNIQ